LICFEGQIIPKPNREEISMDDRLKTGLTMFPTDYAIHPGELAAAAEERGFESLWFAEHSHIPASRESPWPGGAELPQMYYDVADPFVALSMAAQATTTLKIATGICLVIQRDPIQTAKSVASLDALSGGRFLFGVGGGWNREEMANHGTAFEGRWKLLRERIEAMKAIWTQDPASYEGEHVSFEAIVANPKPAQKPHPPIHVGGAYPGGMRAAGRKRRGSRLPRQARRARVSSNESEGPCVVVSTRKRRSGPTGSPISCCVFATSSAPLPGIRT
jgi:probable F420-dependent oxidoreductase